MVWEMVPPMRVKDELRRKAYREWSNSYDEYLRLWVREIKKFVRLQIWRRAIEKEL